MAVTALASIRFISTRALEKSSATRQSIQGPFLLEGLQKMWQCMGGILESLIGSGLAALASGYALIRYQRRVSVKDELKQNLICLWTATRSILEKCKYEKSGAYKLYRDEYFRARTEALRFAELIRKSCPEITEQAQKVVDLDGYTVLPKEAEKLLNMVADKIVALG